MMEFCPSSCIPPSLRKTPRSSSAGAHILHHPPASCRTCPRTGSDEDVNTILLQQPAAFREALERLYRDADGKWLGMLELLCRLILQCIQVERERERESIQSTSFAPAAVAEHGNASASGALAARENKLKEHYALLRRISRTLLASNDIDAKALLGDIEILESTDASELQQQQQRSCDELKRTLTLQSAPFLSKIAPRVTGLAASKIYRLCAIKIVSSMGPQHSSVEEGAAMKDVSTILGKMSAPDLVGFVEEACIPNRATCETPALASECVAAAKHAGEGVDWGGSRLSIESRVELVKLVARALRPSTSRLTLAEREPEGLAHHLDQQSSEAPVHALSAALRKLSSFLSAQREAGGLGDELTPVWRDPAQARGVLCKMAKAGISVGVLRRVSSSLEECQLLAEPIDLAETYLNAIQGLAGSLIAVTQAESRLNTSESSLPAEAAALDSPSFAARVVEFRRVCSSIEQHEDEIWACVLPELQEFCSGTGFNSTDFGTYERLVGARLDVLRLAEVRSRERRRSPTEICRIHRPCQNPVPTSSARASDLPPLPIPWGRCTVIIHLCPLRIRTFQDCGHPIAGSRSLNLYNRISLLVMRGWTTVGGGGRDNITPARVADDTACRALFSELLDVSTTPGCPFDVCLTRLKLLVELLVIWSGFEVHDVHDTGSAEWFDAELDGRNHSTEPAEASPTVVSDSWVDLLMVLVDTTAAASRDGIADTSPDPTICTMSRLISSSVRQAGLPAAREQSVVHHLRETCAASERQSLLYRVGLSCRDCETRDEMVRELVEATTISKKPAVPAMPHTPHIQADRELCSLILSRTEISRFVVTSLYPTIVEHVLAEYSKARAGGSIWVRPFTSSPHHLITQLVGSHMWLHAGALACELQGVHRGLRNSLDGVLCALEGALADSTGLLGCVSGHDEGSETPPPVWEPARRRALCALEGRLS